LHLKYTCVDKCKSSVYISDKILYLQHWELMIRPEDHLDDLLEEYTGLNRSLRRRNIICVQCGEVYWGTLGELVREKGLDVNQIIAELNSEFNSK
jgi:hypothetical protein